MLRKLHKKQNDWVWTEEHTKPFDNLKTLITQLPRQTHYNSNNENIPTTDASTKGLGATLVKTKRRKYKTGQICKQIFIGHR